MTVANLKGTNKRVKLAARPIQEKAVLHRASFYFAQEVYALRGSALGYQEVLRLRRGTADFHPIFGNALVVAFSVHFRKVYDFLFSGIVMVSNPKPDDVIAEDYFPSPESWHALISEPDKYLQTTRRRANKRVAHLTYERVVSRDLADEQWDFAEILNRINPTIEIFRRNAPKAFVSDALFKAILSKLERKT